MRGRVWLIGCILGIAVSLLASPQCFASGFSIWEGSARGTALGQAVVGRADDPSAVFYNPAGITQLPGLQIMGGGTAILLNSKVENPLFGSQKTDEKWGFPPHAYVTYQATDRVWFGVGVFTPFGNSTKFPDRWFGGFNSTDAEVQSVTINPNIAFKVNDQLSLAVGFEAVEFGLTLKQLFPNFGALLAGGSPFNPATADMLKLDGSSWGYGFNIAARYQPCPLVAMGISYRSQVKQEGTLDVDLAAFSPGFPVPTGHTTARANLNLPDSLAFGVAFYPTKCLSWEIGATWTNWQTFKQIQFSLDSPILAPLAGTTLTSTKNWHDTWRFQTGVEYKALPWLDLRAGYIFDQEAIPDQFADYLLPSNDRHYFSFGPGFHWCNWTLDISYTYIMVEDRNVLDSKSSGYVNPSFLTDGNAHLIGASVGYKF